MCVGVLCSCVCVYVGASLCVLILSLCVCLCVCVCVCVSMKKGNHFSSIMELIKEKELGVASWPYHCENPDSFLITAGVIGIPSVSAEPSVLVREVRGGEVG